MEGKEMRFFERYLTVWVLLCMGIGMMISVYAPAIPQWFSRLEYAHVSIPVAILIWLMIYPMLLQIDFSSVRQVGRQPKGLVITWVTNWLVKPITMFGIAYVFFHFVFSPWISDSLAREYVAGAVLLGAAPCTAMVFVWSQLTRGHAAYTLVQVATNDLIILIAFVPIVGWLLGIGNVVVPWDTLALSIILFVVFPLTVAVVIRKWVIRLRGRTYFEQRFLRRWDGVTMSGLLLTLIIIFSFQGNVIVQQPLNIAWIAVPLVIQTIAMFFLAYFWAKYWKCPHGIAAPAALIGASNFFELAVAVAIALFGLQSGATLVTVVGVLVEVPLMLALVRFANKTKGWFPHAA